MHNGVQQTIELPTEWRLALSIDACDSSVVVFSVNTKYGVFLTTNGGENWEATSYKENFWDISIIDSLHIWGVNYDKILSTIDGGVNWNVQFYDTTLTTFINYIKMFDLQNGIAMGDGLDPEKDPAVFLKTTDGGDTWISINDSVFGSQSGDVWKRLDFINTDIGYFCESGIAPQKLYKTTNGGSKWKYANYEGGLQILKFYNKDIGLLKETNYHPEYSYNFQRTLDGGNTWQSIALEYEGWGNDIEFLPNDPSQVWYVDGINGYHFLHSNDTGRTWTNQTMPVENSAGRDIVFADNKHGWILCDDGKLFYTNNNGGIVTAVEKEIKNTLPTEFKLEQNYPNPFNPSTTIKYSIPNNVESLNETTVQLKIYDVLGKEVATLVNKKQSAGSYNVVFDAKELPSGIYFFSMQTGKFRSIKKSILMK